MFEKIIGPFIVIAFQGLRVEPVQDIVMEEMLVVQTAPESRAPPPRPRKPRQPRGKKQVCGGNCIFDDHMMQHGLHVLFLLQFLCVVAKVEYVDFNLCLSRNQLERTLWKRKLGKKMWTRQQG